MRKLPYGIEPAPPDLERERTWRDLYRALGVAFIILAVSACLALLILHDGPPPSERPSDTFYGLSEGE